MNTQEVKNLEEEEDREIKGIDKFKYLGFIVSKKGTPEFEITSTSENSFPKYKWDYQKRKKEYIYKSHSTQRITYGTANETEIK